MFFPCYLIVEWDDISFKYWFVCLEKFPQDFYIQSCIRIFFMLLIDGTCSADISCHFFILPFSRGPLAFLRQKWIFGNIVILSILRLSFSIKNQRTADVSYWRGPLLFVQMNSDSRFLCIFVCLFVWCEIQNFSFCLVTKSWGL